MKKLLILFYSIFSIISFAQEKINLSQEIKNITKDKNATVSVHIESIEGKDRFSYDSRERMPMQSVFKFHIAATALDLVDRALLDLEKKILIKKTDLLENTWSPIREKYPNGNVELSYAEIINYTVAQSDNNGCDILLRIIGGPKAVQEFMDSKKVRNFQIKFNEEQMHQNWDAQYENYTTTESMALLLKSFYQGELLSQSSTDFLMNIMLGTSTGTNKLKEQLPQGTPVAHKTGSSGKNEEGLTGAENDAGIITLPSGKHYTIAVFISDSMESEEVNCKMISDISKLAFDYLSKK